VNTAQLNRRRAVQLVDTAIALGLRHAVISPGARNTPVVLALHDAREAGKPIALHSVIDERAAGFFALGIARRTDRPVLLSCTSGSAAAHYFPAIVEASEGQVPLMVVTADRPEELQDCGAPQTMPQANLYGQQVRYGISLDAPSAVNDIKTVARVTRDAWSAAIQSAPGPVHINLRFRKPLWAPDSPVFQPVPIQSFDRLPLELTPDVTTRFIDEVRDKRGIIVVGTDSSQRLNTEAVVALGQQLGWPILADPVNGLRFGASGPIVRHHDTLLRSERFRDAFIPELAITIGGTSSSRPLEHLLRATPCIAINDSGRRWDPWGSVKWTIQADVDDLLSEVSKASIPPTTENWCTRWLKADATAQAAIQTLCADGLWEGSIAHQMVANLPQNTLLRIASSMPIRDMDSFAVNDGTSIAVSSNRGVNGIDGTIATTFGEALVHNGPTAVLMGDLSFIHDASALLTTPKPETPTVITVVNNAGGGIFGFLPMKDHPTGFTPWYITPHSHDIAAIARAAGIETTEPTTLSEYVEALKTGIESPGVTLIHVQIDRELSTQKHTETWSSICQAIESTL